MADYPQIASAHALVGRAVRFKHQGDEAAYRVIRAIDGMVELDGLVGRFGPHLFVVLDRTPAVSEVKP